MKIKRFKLREGVTLDALRKKHLCRNGGTWVNPNSVIFCTRALKGDVTATIALPEDLSKWNDFDYILVLDEKALQPYTPFYGDRYGRDITGFSFLEEVIKNYNDWLSSMDFLEEMSGHG